MSAFNAAKAVLIALHGSVSADSNAVGIPQEFDYALVSGITATPERSESVKTGGMGEEALTLMGKPSYTLEIDAEGTGLQSKWNNRHPGEVLTYESLAIYGADIYIRHQFPTGSGCSWLLKPGAQGRRAGDLFTLKPSLKLLWKPELAAITVDPAAL